MRTFALERKPAPPAGPVMQAGRSRANAAEMAVGPVARDVLQRPGQPLDAGTRSAMEARFDHDFSRVRVHSDSEAARAAGSLGARAYTVGRNIVFGRDEYAPGNRSGKTLLAHELAHVVQQGRSPIDTRSVEPAGSPAEREAHAAAAAVAGGGGPVRVTAASQGINRDVGWAQRGPLPDPYGMGYNTILTHAGAPAEPAIRDLASLEKADLSVDVQEFWAMPAGRADAVLALQPHAKGTGAEAWFPILRTMPANPMALLDPYSGAPSPVKAHFVQGRSDRKALILGGVHNKTEPQGARVVKNLLTLLTIRTAAKKPPFFSVVLIPDLFDAGRYKGGAGRWIGGGMGQDEQGQLETARPVEPNRNFPLPGEDLAAARARGSSSAITPELVFRDPAKPAAAPRAAQDASGGAHGGTSIRMLPETRTLIALIEHFKPERIASVHAHSLKKTPGDAPGIFVDPRGMDPQTGLPTGLAADAVEAAEDDRLATAMVTRGRKGFPGASGTDDPFIGNAAGTPKSRVRYASGAHAEGNSLGTWAPVPVTSGPGARGGITTMTIEVPQWKDDPAALKRIETLESELLADIFLEDPAVVTPSTTPTTP
ncbi:MAG TPA: DUF4157 domain-containing protein [Longimicrobium sp.]|nr:DUF4157 domain-containing protein [Longimicrobium sp.]